MRSWKGETKFQADLPLVWVGLFGLFLLPPLAPLCPLTVGLVGIGLKTPENPLESFTLPSAHGHRQRRGVNAADVLGTQMPFPEK